MTTYNRHFSAKRNVYLDTIIWDEICDGVSQPRNHHGDQGKGA